MKTEMSLSSFILLNVTNSFGLAPKISQDFFPLLDLINFDIVFQSTQTTSSPIFNHSTINPLISSMYFLMILNSFQVCDGTLYNKKNYNFTNCNDDWISRKTTPYSLVNESCYRKTKVQKKWFYWNKGYVLFVCPKPYK